MIRTIQLLRNVGTFDSVTSGAKLSLTKFALIYAENGRGKTTLAAVLRSLGSGDPLPILERKRLGAPNPPHVVIASNDGQLSVFQNGNWMRRFGDIIVFDDRFVAENVYSGMQVETIHRQKLHELIIGAHGVALNQALQAHIARVEQHNRDLSAKANLIPAEARGGLGVDAFCALEPRDEIDTLLQEAELNLAAARDADAVQLEMSFSPITMPRFDLAVISELLDCGLPDLEAEAATRVQAHLARIGEGGEAWISDGMKRIEPASIGEDHPICPFCAQDLPGSPLIAHYQAYFSTAYSDLRRSVADAIHELNTTHRGEVQAAFERAVRVASHTQRFWVRFTKLPEVALDTAAVVRSWTAAFNAVSEILLCKKSSPLERIEVDAHTAEKVATYHALRAEVTTLSDSLLATNAAIQIIKEKAAASNVAALENDLRGLRAVKSRFHPDVASLCNDYLAEMAQKSATQTLRDAARQNLDHYRNQEFPAYEEAINRYLQRFNAGFRLGQVASVNIRTGSSCNYSILINHVPVPLSAAAEGNPSFRNTLSAGDRNALALAFFFASLERDANRNRKIVVIDDPMTSLDEHRALTTVQEMRRLVDDVEQVIVLSHSKPFLCTLWEGTDTALRSALKIVRANPGSLLADWDVNQDCITEHDRRHAMVQQYIVDSVGSDERAVAVALRPILEAFMRVAYPEWYPPGALLGQFLGLCQQYEGTLNQILSPEDRRELRALLDYANCFHHDTNMAWQTAVINDVELSLFARRTLAFTRR